jgi:pyruvate kinase
VNKTDSSLFDINLNHKYLFFRRTKIVATIGPASSSPRVLRQLISKGLDVARINFSHGRAEEHVRTIRLIRKIAAEYGKSVAILGDLCGPKIRVGEFESGSIVLREHTTVRITTQTVLGKDGLIPSQYKGIVREVRPGDPVLLDDGNLELRVLKKAGDAVEARVVRGGVLKNHKGMNLPKTYLNVSALTAKDRNDVLHCIRAGVDYIALSFVRKPNDISELKNLLRRRKASIPVIAKIEMPEALKNIGKIVALADGIMVARGDLGVELPAKKVPIIQNKLIQIANECHKPVIVATQMLESMMTNARPTRAEVTDVAGACLAGADAVMLSGETAAGKYPVETFLTMDSILRETEAYQFFAQGGVFSKTFHELNGHLYGAIGAATAQISRDLMVRCVFVYTASGYTAEIISSDRPAAPVIALTRSLTVMRRLHLYWGVYPQLLKKSVSRTEHLAQGVRTLKRLHLARRGDYIVLISGFSNTSGGTATVMVHQVG